MTAVHNHRRGLRRTIECIERGELTIGFLGGSITDGRARQNWPEPVIAWFVDCFPGLKVNVENAAIGATASNLAAFRCERDIIRRGCDLVFIEYAVNDQGLPAARRMRAREGLLRQLLSGGRSRHRDRLCVRARLVCGYDERRIAPVGRRIRTARRALRHRLRLDGNACRWRSDERRDELGGMAAGRTSSVRPGGSLSYAQSVTSFLNRELLDAPDPGGAYAWPERPAPLDTDLWEHVSLLDFSLIERQGPWTVRRCLNNPWIDRTLETAAVGARLAFTFTGRGLALGFDYGKASSEYMIRLDGDEWTTTRRDRPDWCGNDGVFWTDVVSDDLPAGKHRCELVVVHGDRPECKGTNFRLGLIGIIQ
ncbi:SGNH/GDSL hydrolase family protein [Cohnella rhizosphaerae]|uniref:SGNH hydrolase-type esterase domain-containing protein n=1 Tax=Cohnella rhizosphaerae TaxID=1457232 RepID=A0A9X4KZW5_9BACL|nr:SGNH/GDSL hydrolase family protein [Cohnella rhizosphaerae]MDG0813950.1 hypothetical protein [Cohnella rhizosphaerae]